MSRNKAFLKDIPDYPCFLGPHLKSIFESIGSGGSRGAISAPPKGPDSFVGHTKFNCTWSRWPSLRGRRPLTGNPYIDSKGT